MNVRINYVKIETLRTTFLIQNMIIFFHFFYNISVFISIFFYVKLKNLSEIKQDGKQDSSFNTEV